jgi:hypothetical protein
MSADANANVNFVIIFCYIHTYLNFLYSDFCGHNQGCQIVCFQNKNPKFGKILEGL